MRSATFNVLADAYIRYGDYSHVEPGLLAPHARTESIVSLIDALHVDIIGLQEVEEPLLGALRETDRWQTFWSPKARNKPDGCATLVRHGINADEFRTYEYSDGSGHIAQTLRIGPILFANTHIKWASADSPEHIGVKQTKELLRFIGGERPAVIFADCNDRPGGPVRQLIEGDGFVHVCKNEPTAIVDQEHVALDLLAVRGIAAHWVTKQYDLSRIPNRDCPSDHIPIVAELKLD